MSAAALRDVQSAPLALIGSARAGRRTLLDMLLSAKGYEIVACEDGPAVLEFLKENQPAIAIFDHDLPGMDGREICSRMRFISRLADTPIAIVTPPMDEMGGAAEFENFTDTTTADIVEAEPLGKKRLIERLENVIRDQKGMANDGKMTIAIPTMAPPIPELDVPGPAPMGNEMDVFVDDDVDIEVDVARAIYANDGRFDEASQEIQRPDLPEPVETVEAASHTVAEESDDSGRPDEVASEPQGDYPQTGVEAGTTMDDDMNDANEPTSPITEYAEEMFLSEEAEGQPEAANRNDDIDLFEVDDGSVEAGAFEVEAEWPGATEDPTAEVEESVVATETHSDAPWNTFEPEPVGVAAESGRDAEAGREAEAGRGVGGAADGGFVPNKTLVELVTDDAGQHTHGSDPTATAAEEQQQVEDGYGSNEPESARVAAHSVGGLEESEAGPESADDLTATIEAAIEAVNLASMEEAALRAAEAAAEQAEAEEQAGPEEQAEAEEQAGSEEQDRPEPQAVPSEAEAQAEAEESAIDVKDTIVEMVVETAERNAATTEPDHAEPGRDIDYEASTSEVAAATEAGYEPSEVGEPAVPAAEAVSENDAAQAGVPLHEEPVRPVIQDSARSYEAGSEWQAEPTSEEVAGHAEAATEEFASSAKDSAEPSETVRVESPSAEADGQEEGEAEVLNEERTNMQALIAEQAERIDNLQERNVLLRQELEQLKADSASRNEERANLQALIKEQTEAITNLQQRNVQLRQELEQYKAEEAKRESERTFLQSHTSEQAETIAKLQQLNALLRQELEQRKADEAPLRDFLQRLLDRDEQNSAYQEAMRAEIISLTRENS